MNVTYRRPLTGDDGHIHSAEELNVVEGRVYDVLGIVTTPEGCWYFLMSDDRSPIQRQAQSFRIVSHAVPSSWHFNYFPEEGMIVVGPSFLVKSIQNVDDLVELRPYQLENSRFLLEHPAPED